MTRQRADIGLYGLGTKGSALALNLAENGFQVAVTNRETSWIGSFVEEAGALGASLTATETSEDFVAALAMPHDPVHDPVRCADGRHDRSCSAASG